MHASRSPGWPRLWVNAQILKAIGWAVFAGLPRLARSVALTVRDAVRALRHAPAQSLFVIFILGIGIAAGTVTFSVVDAVVLRPLPFDHPEQLVQISTWERVSKPRITSADFQRLRTQAATLQRLAAYSSESGGTATVGGVTRPAAKAFVTADYFEILELKTHIGRVWTTDDDARGVTDVAVLGFRFWQQQLRGDPLILGQVVSSGPGSYRVIGIMAEASNAPDMDLTRADLWLPKLMSRDSSFALLGRMRPGVSTSDVAAEIQRATGSSNWQPTVRRQLEAYVSRVADWMLLALGAAGFVVLIACVNAANVMLTRSAQRSHEIAIRASLGASRRQIAASVLTEGLILSCTASAGALVVAVWGASAARSAITSLLGGMFRASTISVNGRVLIAATAAALATGAICAVVPAWQTSRVSVLSLLKDAGPTVTGSRRRWRSVFLVAEVASVSVLLVVSWLFVSSMVHALSIDLGIDRSNLMAVKSNTQFLGPVDEVERRLRQVPGVEDVAVAIGASLPLIGHAYGGAWGITALTPVDSATPAPVEALDYRVTANYFAVAGLRFRRGSTWPAAGAADEPVVVLDEEAARQIFGDNDPVGQRIRSTAPVGTFTVVGTVAHIYARGPEGIDTPAAYFSLTPSPTRTFAGLFARTSRPVSEVLPFAREALAPFAPVSTLPFVVLADDALNRITATRRFNAGLMMAFGAIGMLIAAAGIYAVMASIVAHQTREIGVRLALGATPQTIRRAVMLLAGRHLLLGLAIGLPCGWLVSRGFAALFFRVAPTDASVYAGVAALLAIVGFGAVLIPAHRAARVDPIISLRA